MDTNGDGHVTNEEFINWLLSNARALGKISD